MRDLDLPLLQSVLKYNFANAVAVNLEKLDIGTLGVASCGQKPQGSKNDKCTTKLSLRSCLILNASYNALTYENVSMIFWDLFPDAWWISLDFNPISSFDEYFPSALGRLSLKGTNISSNDTKFLSSCHVLRFSHSSSSITNIFLINNCPNVWSMNDVFISSIERRYVESQASKENEKILSGTFACRSLNDREKVLIHASNLLPRDDYLRDCYKLDIILEDYLYEAEYFNEYGLHRQFFPDTYKPMPLVDICKLFALPRSVKLDLSVLLTISIYYDLPIRIYQDAMMLLLYPLLGQTEIFQLCELPSVICTSVVCMLRRLCKREYQEYSLFHGALPFHAPDPIEPIVKKIEVELPRKKSMLDDVPHDTALKEITRPFPTYSTPEEFMHLKIVRQYLARPLHVDNPTSILPMNDFTELEKELLFNLPDIPTPFHFEVSTTIINEHSTCSTTTSRYTDMNSPLASDWKGFLCRHGVLLLTKSSLCPSLLRLPTNATHQALYNHLQPLLKAAAMTFQDLDVGISSFFPQQGRRGGAALPSSTEPLLPQDSLSSASLHLNSTSFLTEMKEVNQVEMSNSDKKKTFGGFQAVKAGQILEFGEGLPKGSTARLSWNLPQHAPLAYERPWRQNSTSSSSSRPSSSHGQIPGRMDDPMKSAMTPVQVSLSSLSYVHSPPPALAPLQDLDEISLQSGPEQALHGMGMEATKEIDLKDPPFLSNKRTSSGYQEVSFHGFDELNASKPNVMVENEVEKKQESGMNVEVEACLTKTPSFKSPAPTSTSTSTSTSTFSPSEKKSQPAASAFKIVVSPLRIFSDDHAPKSKFVLTSPERLEIERNTEGETELGMKEESKYGPMNAMEVNRHERRHENENENEEDKEKILEGTWSTLDHPSIVVNSHSEKSVTFPENHALTQSLRLNLESMEQSVDQHDLALRQQRHEKEESRRNEDSMKRLARLKKSLDIYGIKDMKYYELLVNLTRRKAKEPLYFLKFPNKKSHDKDGLPAIEVTAIDGVAKELEEPSEEELLRILLGSEASVDKKRSSPSESPLKKSPSGQKRRRGKKAKKKELTGKALQKNLDKLIDSKLLLSMIYGDEVNEDLQENENAEDFGLLSSARSWNSMDEEEEEEDGESSHESDSVRSDMMLHSRHGSSNHHHRSPSVREDAITADALGSGSAYSSGELPGLSNSMKNDGSQDSIRRLLAEMGTILNMRSMNQYNDALDKEESHEMTSFKSFQVPSSRYSWMKISNTVGASNEGPNYSQAVDEPSKDPLTSSPMLFLNPTPNAGAASASASTHASPMMNNNNTGSIVKASSSSSLNQEVVQVDAGPSKDLQVPTVAALRSLLNYPNIYSSESQVEVPSKSSSGHVMGAIWHPIPQKVTYTLEKDPLTSFQYPQLSSPALVASSNIVENDEISLLSEPKSGGNGLLKNRKVHKIPAVIPKSSNESITDSITATVETSIVKSGLKTSMGPLPILEVNQQQWTSILQGTTSSSSYSSSFLAPTNSVEGPSPPLNPPLPSSPPSPPPLNPPASSSLTQMGPASSNSFNLSQTGMEAHCLLDEVPSDLYQQIYQQNIPPPEFQVGLTSSWSHDYPNGREGDQQGPGLTVPKAGHGRSKIPSSYPTTETMTSSLPLNPTKDGQPLSRTPGGSSVLYSQYPGKEVYSALPCHVSLNPGFRVTKAGSRYPPVLPLVLGRNPGVRTTSFSTTSTTTTTSSSSFNVHGAMNLNRKMDRIHYSSNIHPNYQQQNSSHNHYLKSSGVDGRHGNRWSSSSPELLEMNDELSPSSSLPTSAEMKYPFRRGMVPPLDSSPSPSPSPPPLPPRVPTAPFQEGGGEGGGEGDREEGFATTLHPMEDFTTAPTTTTTLVTSSSTTSLPSTPLITQIDPVAYLHEVSMSDRPEKSDHESLKKSQSLGTLSQAGGTGTFESIIRVPQLRSKKQRKAVSNRVSLAGCLVRLDPEDGVPAEGETSSSSLYSLHASSSSSSLLGSALLLDPLSSTEEDVSGPVRNSGRDSFAYYSKSSLQDKKWNPSLSGSKYRSWHESLMEKSKKSQKSNRLLGKHGHHHDEHSPSRRSSTPSAAVSASSPMELQSNSLTDSDSYATDFTSPSNRIRGYDKMYEKYANMKE